MQRWQWLWNWNYYGREPRRLLGKTTPDQSKQWTVSISCNPQADSGCGLFIHGFYYVETVSYFVLCGFIAKGRGWIPSNAIPVLAELMMWFLEFTVAMEIHTDFSMLHYFCDSRTNTLLEWIFYCIVLSPVPQTGLKLTMWLKIILNSDPPASMSSTLRLQVCTMTLGLGSAANHVCKASPLPTQTQLPVIHLYVTELSW